ncbi:MAG: molybdopterin cofactor-binding domain-containing protein [Bacteroidales bacterium]
MNYEDETPDGTFPPMPDVNRRDFLKVFGAGITIFFTVDGLKAFQEPARLPAGRQGYPTDFNAYLRVQVDGRVACFAGKVELGQGSMTALPQLVAEELDVPLDKVDITLGDTDVCPWDMGTFGSLTIRQFGPVFRAAAAEARLILLALAAEKLQVPAEQLRTENGAVVAGTGTGAKRLTYAELAQGKAIERHLDKRPEIKKPVGLKVIGKSVPRRDITEKVAGKAKYAADIILPGMLHAKLVRPPAHGARLKSVDTSAAEKVSGAQVVRDGDMVAVVHQYPDEAERARDAVKAEWDVPPSSLDDVTIFEHLVKDAPRGQLVHESGNLVDGERAAAATFDSTFLNSYVAHAPIELHAATASIEDGKATVWVSTQAPFTVKSQVMQALGLPGDKVRVITPFVGGGFGGKTAGPQAVEAARLAKLTGKPVQVMWGRDEEFFYDTFRPAAVVKIKSGTSAAGKIVAWDFTVYAAGDRDARQFYDVPNQRTMAHGGWQGGQPAGYHPFGVGPWRAPSVNTNTFARESQIDIMAAKAGIDPVEFRRRNLVDPRMLRVLDAAAARFKWVPGKAPSGRGVGVSLAMYSGSYVATFAELAVNRSTGHVTVKRLVCAEEIGQIVNPEGATLQIEGSLTMGLGYALTEEVHFKGGNVLDRNFDSYLLPRFSWLPRIETILVPAPDQPASGGGEPPIVGVGAVIANAIFDATGARLYQLPMTPERIKAALAKT